MQGPVRSETTTSTSCRLSSMQHSGPSPLEAEIEKGGGGGGLTKMARKMFPLLKFHVTPVQKLLEGTGSAGARIKRLTQVLTALGLWNADPLPDLLGRGPYHAKALRDAGVQGSWLCPAC